MLNTIKQWLFAALAILIAWPLSTWTLESLRGYDGSAGVPLSRDPHPADAFLPLAASFAAFAALGWVAARLTHRYVGPLIFGLCWLVLAHRFTPVDTMLRMAVSDPAVGPAALRSLYFKFTLETFFSALLASLFAFACAKSTPSLPERARLEIPDSLTAAAVSIIGTLALAWLFLRTQQRDQAVGGLVAASAIAVMLVRMIWTDANGTLLVISVPVIAGTLGSLTAAFLISPAVLDDMAHSSLWPLIRAFPLDWASACLFGSALGIGLARSFSEVDQPEARTAAPASSA